VSRAERADWLLRLEARDFSACRDDTEPALDEAPAPLLAWICDIFVPPTR
jgi:hypothetical protein